jgi:hypothetical protein
MTMRDLAASDPEDQETVVGGGDALQIPMVTYAE